MKIFNDKTAPGYIPEKTETQGRVTKNSTDSGKNAKIVFSGDELELSNRKAAVLDAVRETNIASSTSVDFDAGEVPMMKQRLQVINNYILSNPVEALSAQANVNAENIARLLG